MEKTYVGQAKARSTQYGTMLNVSFSKDDLETLKANLNEKGYVNLNIGERRQISEYGHTHSISIDTWKPEKKEGQEKSRQPKPVETDFDDIPF